MNVSLTPQLESLIKDRVDSGMYSNASEVVREALRCLFQDQMEKDRRNARLQQELMIGYEQIQRGEYSNRTLEEIYDDAMESDASKTKNPSEVS